MNEIPTIRIKTSYLLEDRFQIPRMDEKKVKAIQNEWKKYDYAILRGLQKITKLTFAQNIIDAYVVNPSALGGMSDPLIIGGAIGKKRSIFVLTHELTHRLMFDNKQGVDWHTLAWKLWPKESHLVAHHIVVHAILEILFTNLENIAAIAIDKEISQKSATYRSWKIVEKEGAENIIMKVQKNLPS